MRQAVRCCTAPHRWGRSSALPCREVTLPVPWGDLRRTFPSILQQSLLSPRRKLFQNITSAPPPSIRSQGRALPTFSFPHSDLLCPSRLLLHLPPPVYPSSMPPAPTGTAQNIFPSSPPPSPHPRPTVLPGTGLRYPHPISAAEGTIAVINNPNSPLPALAGFPP